MSDTVFDDSIIEHGRAESGPIPNSSSNETEDTDDSLPIPAPVIRRHRFPNYFPLLTMCRYLSVVYASEFVTTEFASPAIRHSAVSYKT